jgi:hypothetical protein
MMSASVTGWHWALLLPLLVAASACGTPASLNPSPPVGVGCHAGDAYELRQPVVEPGETAPGNWYTMKNDSEPGAVATLVVGQIENGGRCGTSPTSLLFLASGNKDWGCGFGNWGWRGAPLNGQGWDGLALWARSKGVDEAGVPYPTDPGFTISISDQTVQSEAGICVDVADAGPGLTTTNPAGQITSINGQAATNTCGNSFDRPLVVTGEWQLYLLPWASFTQSLNPNRRAGTLDPSAIYNIVFRAPKEAVVALWLDDITFYRAKGAGGDQ